MKTHLKHFLMIDVVLSMGVMTLTTCVKYEHAPFTTTFPATFITQTGATLNGSVDAIGKSATVTFEVGKTTSYGQILSTTESVSGLIIPVEIHYYLKGLTPETTYHYRIKAVGPSKTSYGSDFSFTTLKEGEVGIIFNPDLTYGTVRDIDGNTYKSIQIGNQIWMAENLRTKRLTDGTPVQLVTTTNQWFSQKTPAFCWYNNDSSTYKASVGALYNWTAVNTGRLCPAGWHIPPDSEWTSLINYLGGEELALDKLEEAGTSHWIFQKPGTSNSSGFTALPGGGIYTDYNVSNYGGIGTTGSWWTSTERITTDAWILSIYYSSNIYDHGKIVFAVNPKGNGNSVRCLQD